MKSSIKQALKACILAIAVCGSANHCAAQDGKVWKGNEVTFWGNKFETKPTGKMDSVIIIDPMNRREIVKMEAQPPTPVSMNGKKIYNISEIPATPGNNDIAGQIEEYILAKLRDDGIAKILADGNLRLDIRNIVVDERGDIVYYEYAGLSHKDKDDVPQNLKPVISPDKWMAKVPSVKPAVVDGKKVIVLLNTSMAYDYKIDVKDHIIIYRKERGVTKI